MSNRGGNTMAPNFGLALESTPYRRPAHNFGIYETAQAEADTYEDAYVSPVTLWDGTVVFHVIVNHGGRAYVVTSELIDE